MKNVFQESNILIYFRGPAHKDGCKTQTCCWLSRKRILVGAVPSGVLSFPQQRRDRLSVEPEGGSSARGSGWLRSEEEEGEAGRKTACDKLCQAELNFSEAEDSMRS